jgi:hypothetical protein
MFSIGTEPISPETIAALAQILPALLAIGFLVPILARMKMQSPERTYFAGQTVVVLLSEGVLLYFLIQGGPAPAGLRTLFWTSSFLSLVGIAVMAFAWGRSTRAERRAEQEQYEQQSAARAQAKGPPDHRRKNGPRHEE